MASPTSTMLSAEELLAKGCVSVAGAEAEYALKKSRLYAWMEQGVLPYSQLGAKRLIPRVAIERLLAANLVGAGA